MTRSFMRAVVSVALVAGWVTGAAPTVSAATSLMVPTAPSKLLCYKLEGKPAPYACVRVSNTTPARGETVIVRGFFSPAARVDLTTYLNAWDGNTKRATPGQATVCLVNNGRKVGPCQELTANGRFRFDYVVPKRAPNEATVGRNTITLQVAPPDCRLQANCPIDVNIPTSQAVDLKVR